MAFDVGVSSIVYTETDINTVATELAFADCIRAEYVTRRRTRTRTTVTHELSDLMNACE